MEIKEKTGFYRLSWMQRIGYGSGDLAQNLIFQTVACYLMLYLTTVLKINPAFVSGLILTVRVLSLGVTLTIAILNLGSIVLTSFMAVFPLQLPPAF